MDQNRAHYDNLYRLVIGDDGPGGAHIVEFEGRGPEAALLWASRHGVGREVEVFENGRSLGVLRSEAVGGYWLIRPAVAGAVHGGETASVPRGLTIGLAADRHLE